MKYINFVIDDLTASDAEAEMKEVYIFTDHLRNNSHWITSEEIDHQLN
jgi:hypothetical protein